RQQRQRRARHRRRHPPLLLTTLPRRAMNPPVFETDSLSALFSPRAIAVVGASSSPQKIGGIPIDYARRFGFEGALYAVNPRAAQVQGLPAHTSLRAIGEPVDLAILAVPAALVGDALEDAIAAGVK